MTIKQISSYPIPAAEQWLANKVDWPLEPSKAVLLIHDMQEYFVDFYGTDNPLINGVIEKIGKIKQACHSMGIPVVYTAQPQHQSTEDRALLNDMWGPGLTKVEGKEKVVAALTPSERDTVLTKWRYSAFHRSPLETTMKEQQRDQLLIVGIYGHIGVLQTAVDAFMLDIKPFLIGDAIADFSLDDHIVALNYIARNAGRTVATEEVLTRLVPQIQQSAKATLNKDTLRQQVIHYLDEDDLPENDDNLIDYGLDSVAVMTLIGEWKKAGVELNFSELAKQPTIDAWWRLIANSGSTANG